MDFNEAVIKCQELLSKYPNLSLEQTKELKIVSSIISGECSSAIWEQEKYGYINQ